MRYCVITLLILSVFLFSCRDNPTENNVEPDLIEGIISETNIDSLSHFVQILSGEISTVINNFTCRIPSRNKNHPGNNIAAEYIYGKLQQYGLDVSNQTVSATCRNVYAIQNGSEYPDQHYIICAHYDSMPDSSISPGADDNASGTAAVLEAARIIAGYWPQYSIIYALFDEEEQGIAGALNFANRARNNNENIVGVINLDMIAWDSNDDGRFWINVRDTANSVHLSDRMMQIHDEYDIGLSPQVLNPGYGSDNHAFWRYGFSAIGVEEMYGEDWNDHYHLASDRINQFNLTYFHKLSQLVIGTLASLADVNVE